MIGDARGPRMGKPYKEMGRYGGVGIDLVLAILLLGALGHWLDGRYFGGHDYAMMTGGFLGVAVGVRSLVRAARRMQKDIEAAEADRVDLATPPGTARRERPPRRPREAQ